MVSCLVCTGLDESVAVMVVERVPLAVGVPETAPEDEEIESPAGSEDDAYVYGVVPPEAVAVPL